MKEILAADLFAGAGGMSLGFKQTGKIRTIFAVENNKNAKKTYQKNHKQVTRVLDNIIDIDFKKLADELSQEGLSVDLVIGGPPCQGFSNANRQKNDLVSSNNQLVKHYLRAIEQLNPKALIMENVKMMGSNKHKFFFSIQDKEEIELLGLEDTLNFEYFLLAKSTLFDEELVYFVNNNNGFKDYCLEKEVYLKFINILRNSATKNKFQKFIDKNNTIISRLIEKWNEFHKKTWSKSYLDFWENTKQDFLTYLKNSSNFEQLIESITIAVEVQKIFHKMNEVEDNKIEYEPIKAINDQLLIKLRTYNVLEYVLAKLKYLNYKIDKRVLNSAHFGVPQERERLFIMGVKKEHIACGKQVSLPEAFFHENKEFNTVFHAIKDLEAFKPKTENNSGHFVKDIGVECHPLTSYLNDSNFIYNHVMTETRETAQKRFEKLGPGQNFHDLKDADKSTYTDPSRTQNTIYQRLDYNSPSGTVLNVRKSMWIHPLINRAISIREAARLQSFPDSFVFEGTKDSQYQQIGNAVPPLLGRAVAEQLLDIMGIQVESKLEDELKAKTQIAIMH